MEGKGSGRNQADRFQWDMYDMASVHSLNMTLANKPLTADNEEFL